MKLHPHNNWLRMVPVHSMPINGHKPLPMAIINIIDIYVFVYNKFVWLTYVYA